MTLRVRAAVAIVASLLLSAVVVADDIPDAKDDSPDSKADRTGFTAIFDGKSLNDWDGDPKYWTVEEGKLVGTVTPETLLKQNSWIVWRGGMVEDFELVLDYRVSAEGNSGVGYRLAVLESDPFSVRGPQADIHGVDLFTGICYEENGRRLLAGRGQTTWIDNGELPKLTAQQADPDELLGVVRKNDWNRYRLVAKGEHAEHYLNGVLMSAVDDHDDANRVKQGLIGVQVHVGPPMKIEYRDIYLKHLGTPPKGDLRRGSLTYKSGSLREPEHQATFENLVNQAKRATAPSVPKPIDGQKQLSVNTRDVVVVRHDLRDIALFSGKRKDKPAPSKVPNEADYDLVIISGEQTIRVPGAGHLMKDKSRAKPFSIQLNWNDAKSEYDVAKIVDQ